MTNWFDRLRGKKTSLVPDELWFRTVAALPFLDELADDEKRELKAIVETFLADKEFSAAGELELSDEICVSIAAQACLPILRLGLSAYREWVGIVVYPDEFVVPRRIEDEVGVIHEYDDVLSGEAWAGGPLLVSWRDAQMAGDGYNVVIHEAAHKLDMLNGEADGMPALHAGIGEIEWQTTFVAAYENFCRRVDDGEDTAIDPYAGTAPAEFFAVLTESFFEIPEVVAGEYPELYDLLSRYYRQDPLARRQKAANRPTA